MTQLHLTQSVLTWTRQLVHPLVVCLAVCLLVVVSSTLSLAQAQKTPTLESDRQATSGRADNPESSSPANTIISDGIPAFHLARLELSGQVDGDRATVTAHIDVDVNRDGGGYHDVPLRLQQAHVLKKEYSGPGREGPIVDVPTEEGIVWRFSGYGTHHLKLTMWVPIKESPAGRQLVLSLPTMPPGFDAQVSLTIPGAPVALRGSRELTVLSSQSVDGKNEILANVRGPRLDLTWSEPPEVQTSFRQVKSSFTLVRDGDRVLVQTEQVLIPENLGVKSTEVKLPQGFDLEDVTGEFLKSHEPIPSRPGWRKLTFREGIGERIELSWTLAAPFAADGGTLAFDGLMVPEARNQSGQIRLQDFPGYQLIPRPGQFVRRAPASTPQVAEIFEYTKQPFRIEWSIQKIVPKFSARTRSVLFVAATQLSLDQKYQFQTDSGSLEHIDFVWPDAVAQGWRLDPSSITGDAFIPLDGDRLGRDGKLRVSWKTPRFGTFELSVRLIRSLDSDLTGAQFQLPGIPAARSMPTEMLIAAEDQLDVSVRDSMGTSIPASSIDPQKLIDVPATLISQMRHSLTLAADLPSVDLAWKSQSRVVEAESEVELRRASSGRIRVRQLVQYQIRFGRMSVFQWELPKSLGKQLEPGSAGLLASVDGEAVTPRIHDGILELTSPAPRIGRVSVTLDYAVPTSGATAPTVPVLTALDATYSASRVKIPEGEPLRVSPGSTEWQPVPTAPDALVWVTSSATQIPVNLQADSVAAPRFSVEQATYRTRYDATGLCEGVCEFHWNGGVRVLPLTLPPHTELLAVRCNGINFSSSSGQIDSEPGHPENISLRLPTTQGNNVRLAILYRSTKAIPFSQRDLRTVPLPELPSDASIVHSYWELELPPGRHLFIGPPDLTAEHRWQRSGLFWLRQPLTAYGKIREQNLTEAAQLTPLSDLSQVYAYSSIGPIVIPRFQSMSRSLILLLGAGLTLSMGFLFWNLPVTRNMLTLLLIAFGTSLLSLWFLEPIQLLLQPAILGIILAILASIVDFRSRRPTSIFLPPTIPMTPPTQVAPMPPSGADHESVIPVQARGSSVSQHTSQPVPQTALYMPHSSEVREP